MYCTGVTCTITILQSFLKLHVLSMPAGGNTCERVHLEHQVQHGTATALVEHVFRAGQGRRIATGERPQQETRLRQHKTCEPELATGQSRARPKQ